jgi:small subunit ribosomal protein S2
MHAIAEKGGKVLFVGTKKQAQEIVMEEALRSGSFYVNQRWLGGILTNFRTIQKRIRRLVEIEEMEASGSMEIYPKKEQAILRKEAAKLENNLGGIKEMKKLPDALFVVDPTEDKIAVLEAKKLRIPVFGLADTNCDPDLLDYVIPANDDAVKSIRLIVGCMADAICDTKEGVLAYAFQPEEGEDITMKDVIVNVEQQYEENEKRRKAAAEARRAQQQNRQRRQWVKRDNNKAEENKEVKAEEKAEKVEEKAEEVKNEEN